MPEESSDPGRGLPQPTVSVCMPVSRGAAVARSLQSVLGQTVEDIEVLIGDDVGDTREVVARAADPRVAYTTNPRRLGMAGNHVALLDRARGRYMAVLHDDDWWEPGYLAALVAALESDPESGFACCATVVDRSEGAGRVSTVPWPLPLAPGQHRDPLVELLANDWFLLPSSTIWRSEVWKGPAREWPEDLCCADMQLFLSGAEAGWALSVVDAPLAHWVQHTGQSTSERGPDHGLAIAQDVLTFWERWLEARPPELAEATAVLRATWHVKRARALILSGRRREAKADLLAARALAGTKIEAPAGLRLAAELPTFLVRAAVAAKRWTTER